jgi:hypothetical protein
MTVDEFIRSIEDGTADEGAQLALWQLVKRMDGKAVIDCAEPESGWKLRTEKHAQSRYVIPVAGGREAEGLKAQIQ